ncbi:MAG TPA: hypothetical protein VFQ53_43290 [Kofleriaceae bacterium]|nr:hypothetical protein [Kofleriaceae bacterium]
MPKKQVGAGRITRRRKSNPTIDTATAYGAVDVGRMKQVRRRLLRWFGESGRSFFWREQNPDPFTVLVVEMLLTKTRAELVGQVGRELLDRYPNAHALSRAKPRDLQRVLYPLGLHRKRSKQLVLCAETLVRDFDGQVPSTVAELLSLPYVGRYAANAVACVAFGAAVAVIDANVSRIYQRMFSLPPPHERLALAHDLWTLADRILPPRNARAFNWAILDLGGTVCTPKSPTCSTCPVVACCDLGRHETQGESAALRAPGSVSR